MLGQADPERQELSKFEYQGWRELPRAEQDVLSRMLRSGKPGQVDQVRRHLGGLQIGRMYMEDRDRARQDLLSEVVGFDPLGGEDPHDAMPAPTDEEPVPPGSSPSDPMRRYAQHLGAERPAAGRPGTLSRPEPQPEPPGLRRRCGPCGR
jgi:hypothetical protein